MQSELISRYYEIEQEILPVMKFLEGHKHEEAYKELYKGFITLQSPLLSNPEILFLGINPGQGVFIENKNNGIKDTIRIFKPDKSEELDWYKNGNARCQKRNGKWSKGYEWYERNKGINNKFGAKMIDLLYEIADLKYPDETLKSDGVPLWFGTFGQKIMFTNLYPIATENTDGLKKIMNLLKIQTELNTLFKNPKDEWEVRRYFVQRIRDLVKLVKPKVIVCIGFTAFDDFTYNQKKRKYVDGGGKRIVESESNEFDIPVLGFSRKGSWEKLIPKIAMEIYKYLQKNEST